jgi:putative tryptophan/tyrosine transport system substrate-binding protein
MQRREFVTLLCMAAWPPVARAQQLDRMRRIAVLMSSAESDPERQKELRAFQEGLRELGWIDGRNIQIDIRWAPDLESMQRFAKDLVALQPDVILAPTTSATQSILEQTHTIPIIFTFQTIPSAVASSRASPSPAAMSLVSPIWSQRRPPSGWSCLRRPRRTSTGSPSYSTRQRRHILNIT